jgi:tetratricopeptide (TPR) repeat protein
MKIILTLFLSLTVMMAAAQGQQINYPAWQQEAKADINLQPEYGNVKKDAAHVAIDNEFIATALKQDTTRKKASDHLVQLGFKYLSQGDMETAMKRFNQAWLMDPKNSDVYWGYGAIYGTFKDYPAAIAQYDKGLAINARSSKIITDKGTLFLVEYQRDGDPEEINNAMTLFGQSFDIDPTNVNTVYKLSVCFYLSKDCANAWKFYRECQRLGGQPIGQDYTTALQKMCPNQ